ncbi:glycosyltransferase family 4 protein [Paenibacillus sp. GCM10023248]|uniref:glycosyltransferase family 4 protein n=1 Tax=Bacillales TaxID=1385 RepID=UPI00237873CC|nr:MULTISPECIES: glycosyltransferase family 1 protein [Bacillales]MDD9268921.1 glycosyltransferase family 1 protein [Paenibacillus sp. MAHUQ-63]MDR6882000.1 glycosyltransferase involved in cell wall biosynthesis [Bacillus sp. 3255]
MRLALFTDTYVPQMNGVALTLGRLTDHLHRRGIEHLVFTPKCTDEMAYSELIRPVPSVPFFLYPECRIALPNLLSLRSELDRFRPHLIHLATPFNIGLCGLHYARKHRISHVASYHTHFDRYLVYYRMKRAIPFYWSYMKWFHQSCDAIFAPSADTIRDLQSQGFANLLLWSRGVDCSLYTPERRSDAIRAKYGITAPFLLLYVGRIAPEKDIDTLSAVMREMPDSLKSRVHWLVVGDGPQLPELREQAPGNVTFAGYKQGEELAEIYASSDLFVFPSSTETFGNVVQEAMASGLPVIGANSGGVRDMVATGRTGMLCTPREPESFIRAIEACVDGSEQLAGYRQAARTFALGRSWEAIFDGLLQDYAQMIDARRIGSKPGFYTA